MFAHTWETVISQQFDRCFTHYTQTNSFGLVWFLLLFSGKSGSTQSDTMWCRPSESQRYLQEKVSLSNKNIYIISRLYSEFVKLLNLFIFRFLDKTKNEWDQLETFEKVAGKYDMVFMDYSTDEKAKISTKAYMPPRHIEKISHACVYDLK